MPDGSLLVNAVRGIVQAWKQVRHSVADAQAAAAARMKTARGHYSP
jgi:hypothetical protein